MKITKKILSLGLALALLFSMALFPLSKAPPALASDGIGSFPIFQVTPTSVAPGGTVTFTFSFLPSVYVPTGYIEVVAVPGGLANPQPNPQYFTNVPTGLACNGSISYTVTATSGTINAYGVFYIVTETGTYFSSPSALATISVGNTLSINKTTTATTVVSGSIFPYTITVTNNSGSIATQVKVKDYLDSNLEFVSGTTTPSIVGSLLTFSLSDLSPSASASLTFWVRAKTVTSTQTVTNLATATASGFVDSNPGVASPVTIIPAVSVFTKSVDKTQAAPGDTLIYTIKFTNPTGSATVYNAQIIDYIPTYTGYLSASTSLGSVYAPTAGQNYVTWNIGTVAPGVTVTAILNVQIFTTVAWNTVINNTAYFYEGSAITHTAQAPTVTVLPAPFTITKSMTPTLALPGQQVAFSIYYKNNSTTPITNVKVVDTVDSRFTSLAFSTPYSSASGNTYTWNLGTLASGQEGTISFLGTLIYGITPGTVISNTAYIVGDGTAQVTSTDTVLVGLPSALSLNKTVNATNILPDSDAIFTITVQNPTTNPTIPTLTVTDTLPAQLTFKSASSGYTRTDSIVSWTLSNLAPGATGTVTLQATVIPTVAVGSTITNVATLEIGGLTPTTASVSFQVGEAPASPLKVAKIATADSVKGGEYITYIILYANSGSVMLNGAKIEDYIPANTTFLNGNPSPIVDSATGKLTWILGDLPPGANGSIIAMFSVASTVPDGTKIGNVAIGRVQGYQDAVTPSSFVTVGQVLHYSFIQGYPDGTFRPEQPITRAEIAAILSRIMGLNPAAAANPNFSDVSSTHWSYGYIAACAQAGLMEGYPDHTFRPDRSITRAELATVMVRSRGIFPIIVAPPTFPDIAGHWAATYIEAAQRAMFITGYPNGDFRPDQSITRAETVTLINRAYGRGPLSGANVSQTFPDVPNIHWAFAWIAEAAQSHYGVHSTDGTETLISYTTGTLP